MTLLGHNVVVRVKGLLQASQEEPVQQGVRVEGFEKRPDWEQVAEGGHEDAAVKFARNVSDTVSFSIKERSARR